MNRVRLIDRIPNLCRVELHARDVVQVKDAPQTGLRHVLEDQRRKLSHPELSLPIVGKRRLAVLVVEDPTTGIERAGRRHLVFRELKVVLNKLDDRQEALLTIDNRHSAASRVKNNARKRDTED